MTSATETVIYWQFNHIPDKTIFSRATANSRKKNLVNVRIYTCVRTFTFFLCETKLISYLPFPVPKVFGLVVGCARRVRFYSEEECSGCAYGILLLHTRARIGVGRGCYGRATSAYYIGTYRAITLEFRPAEFLWFHPVSPKTQFGVKGTYRMLVTSSTTFEKSGLSGIRIRIF